MTDHQSAHETALRARRRAAALEDLATIKPRYDDTRVERERLVDEVLDVVIDADGAVGPTEAAEASGISRSTILRRIERRRIERDAETERRRLANQ